MTVLDVKAQDLQPGDFLLGSKRTVLSIERFHSTALGRGMVYVTTRTRSGKELQGSWNRTTTMRIERTNPTTEARASRKES